ncbi:uncharacterized protein [Anabrus simplex]|uniref:uncharacterized protein n=1 Tax=Anabrus simplex TaxID=316456 RepID=UPI0035A2CF59
MSGETSQDDNSVFDMEIVTGPPITPKANRKPVYSRTISMDPSIHSESYNAALREEESRPQYEQSLTAPSVVIKELQLVLAFVCIWCISYGRFLLKHNAATVYFHYIVYSSYVIITFVILISYFIGKKMREFLMRQFNVLGAILYICSCLILVQNIMVFWIDWEGQIDEALNEDGKAAIKKQRITLVSLSILTFLNFCLYLADAYCSLRRTFKML